jgi:hypothetical protein
VNEDRSVPLLPAPALADGLAVSDATLGVTEGATSGSLVDAIVGDVTAGFFGR